MDLEMESTEWKCGKTEWMALSTCTKPSAETTFSPTPLREFNLDYEL
jgi:hypothetical protein